jgi:hydrogenase/urease accessory protein HupE
MFDFIRNIAMPEFWEFWGIPFVAVAIAAVAMFYSISIAITPAARRIGIEIAAAALFCGVIYGWGGSKRDALCTAQVAAYEANFQALQDKLNAATAAHAVELEDKIKTVEQTNETKLIAIRAKLAESESGSCIASDEYLDQLRQFRTKAPAAGKR